MPVQNKDIIHHINAQFEKLRDLAGKATKKFDKTQIHHFRVQVKKLRAFLRLLQSNPSQKKKLKIPRDIKKIYRAAGEIRNIQNHRGWVENFFQNKSIPKTYLASLKKKEKTYKQVIKDSLPAKSEFQKEEKEIIHKIGTNGNLAWIDAFLEEKQQSVVRVFAEEKTDTVLHTLRKTLKDLDYNEKWIAQSAEFSQWKSGIGMKELIELLGNHQDYTIHEKFLSSNETAQLNGTDKMLVEEAYRAAAENKAMLKQEILLKLASR